MPQTQIFTQNIKDDAVTTAKIAPNTIIPADLDPLQTYEMAGLTVNGVISSPMVPPIGSIIPFYDYNGALTFNTTYWAYCDGTTKTVGGVSRVLPDLSNRYLAGFGTEGGGDIGTVAWALPAVGNASHQVNIQHSHTVNSHTHTGPSHTHTGPSHTHGAGTLQFQTLYNDTGSIYGYDTGGSQIYVTQFSVGLSTTGGGPYVQAQRTITGVPLTYYTSSGTGATASGGTGATGAAGTAPTGTTAPGSDNQLSTTQSVQPRSIRVRYIMRRA